MNCPICGKRSRVVNTAHRPDGSVHRKQYCHRCNNVFFTREVVAQARVPMYQAPRRF
ncbi:NrdR family transcriptional regulator [Acidithiobacillus sulfuriphilus]|uniref:NrdR family transcriptional regulator n=1 Tax=Acidithiobacillus sulfuriphilus TaxID=1867749 RepID=UPI003F5E2D19